MISKKLKSKIETIFFSLIVGVVIGYWWAWSALEQYHKLGPFWN